MIDIPLKHYLLASDFDQTLSFKDSGLVLSELLGSPRAISCNRAASSPI
jgi:hypothetical protein